MREQTDVFVIGTGPSGMAAARTVKMKRPDVSVTAIRREPSYVPCALPYALAGVIKVDSYVKDEARLMTDLGIRVLDGQVARIVPDRKEVVLEDGTVYVYDKLIAAPGAEPFLPPVPGVEAENVFSVRTPADIHAILDYRRPEMRVAVVGAGYIGVEVACMMREAGHEVAVIELLDRVLPASADAEFSAMAKRQLVLGGVQVNLGVGLEKLLPGDNGPVRSVLLANGTTSPADLVILCLGVRPRLSLFEEAGILAERDGVIVDSHMRTSAPDVFACGDCVHFHCLVDQHALGGKLATNAIFQGKTAALNAIGVERVFEGSVNTCVTDVFGLGLGAAGIREEDAAKAGMKVVAGMAASWDAYPMFEKHHEGKVKLLFDRGNMIVIGGQIAGMQCVAERLDLLALAIRQKIKATDLAELNHCAHPLQSGVPAHNPFVIAAEDAIRNAAALAEP